MSTSTKIFSKLTPNDRDDLRKRFSGDVLFDEPTAPYLAYKVGGPADVLLFPKTESDLTWIREFALDRKLPITIIGNGTNLLVHDDGIPGITLSLLRAFKGIELIEKDPPLVRCGGGTEKQELLRWAIERGLGGFEFSAGVPGTLGGGIFMNAGTKYGCYGDILEGLRVFSFENGVQQYSKKEVRFGYREQSVVNSKTLVVSADFRLHHADPQALGTEVSRIIAEREFKQPLDFPSCGSTFKNPPGLSAGRLIERAGLKGTERGGAQISTKHANFILNKRNASAADIMELITTVQSTVRSQFGVDLECEVIQLGGRGEEYKN